MFVTVTARDLNPDITIIARGENPSTEKKLIGCGADKVVLPTAIGAMKVLHLIVRPSTDSLLEQLTSQGDFHDELGQIGLQFHDLEVHQGSPLVDKTLSDIEVRNNLGFLIVGIRRTDGSTMLNPPATTTLLAGDIVIVLGHDDGLPQLASRFKSSSERIYYRGATMEVFKN